MSAAARTRDLIDMRVLVLVSCLAVPATSVEAQGFLNPAQDFGTFIAGAATALAMHEAGHLTTDVFFGAPPGIKKVSFAGVPFFAITHPTQSPVRSLSFRRRDSGCRKCRTRSC